MSHPTQRTHRRLQHALAWHAALQHAFDEIMPEPRVPGQSSPSIRVINISESGCDIEVELRFHAGQMYCCCEPLDYLWPPGAEWWRKLRSYLAEVTDRDLPPLTLAIRGTIEKGAKFCVHRDFGLPLESEAFTYCTQRRCERDAREPPPLP